MRTRSGNDPFSLQILETMPTPASFHIPAVTSLKTAKGLRASTCIGSSTFLCFRSKRLMNRNGLFPITSVLQSSWDAQSGEISSLLNPLVILETGSWTSPSANKTGNLLSPPHKRTKKKKRKRLALRRTLSRIHKILFFFLRTWQEHRLALKMPKITWDYGMMAH